MFRTSAHQQLRRLAPALILALLALAGCGADPAIQENPPAPSSAATTTSAAPEWAGAEQEFLDYLRDEKGIDSQEAPSKDLLKSFHLACENPKYDALDAMYDNPRLTRNHAAELIAIAHTLCPTDE